MAALNNPTINMTSTLLATRFLNFRIGGNIVPDDPTQDEKDFIETIVDSQDLMRVTVGLNKFSYNALRVLVDSGVVSSGMLALREARVYARAYFRIMFPTSSRQIPDETHLG